MVLKAITEFLGITLLIFPILPKKNHSLKKINVDYEEKYSQKLNK